jgi:hypothetical protein
MKHCNLPLPLLKHIWMSGVMHVEILLLRTDVRHIGKCHDANVVCHVTVIHELLSLS